MAVIILVGDALTRLRELPDESVHCVVTSPPYWGLRAYHGDPGMIGLEPTWDEHVSNLLSVFREVRRVMRPDAVCWLNYGDAYANDSKWGGSTGGKHANGLHGKTGIGRHKVKSGLKPKDLMLMPARLAIALQEDGWWVRSEVCWHKCLSGGAWLYAQTQKGVGPHMLRDLVRLDPKTVKLWNGQAWTQVVAWTEHKGNGPKLELVLRSGERIGCTYDHKWPTQRGLVKAGELSVGDVIQSTTLPDAGECPAWLTDDALWFAGLYLAEGSMSGDTIQLAGHVKETDRWNRIQVLCNHYGASPRLYEIGNSQHIHIDRSHALRAILSTVLSGRTAKDKRLSCEAWSWNNDALKMIIEGYLEGDGSHRDTRIVLGFTRNYYLERDLRCLAARLGATLTIRTSHAQASGKSYPSFRGEWRWSRSGHWSERERSEVVEIRRSRARRFYDVSVADDPHLFALASGVLTKNSNPMPESVTDRPTSAHEKVFLLTKASSYFYDAEAVRQPNTRGHLERFANGKSDREYETQSVHGPDVRAFKMSERRSTGANLRNVWQFATQAFPGSHYAVFPDKLAETCIKAGTSAHGVCAECGGPWRRVVDVQGRRSVDFITDNTRIKKGRSNAQSAPYITRTTTGWHPTCACGTESVVPATVLDPFGGAGTTGLVADRLGRNAVLIEISPEYADMAKRRIEDDGGMFTDVVME